MNKKHPNQPEIVCVRAEFSLGTTPLLLIALVLMALIVGKHLLPAYESIICNAIVVFAVWLAGITSAYSLPIWKRKGATC